jgi:hypothetical protein
MSEYFDKIKHIVDKLESLIGKEVSLDLGNRYIYDVKEISGDKENAWISVGFKEGISCCICLNFHQILSLTTLEEPANLGKFLINQKFTGEYKVPEIK